MNLFEMKDWSLSVRDEAWGLSPFKKILKRDKSRDKGLALKEMLFVYYYCDIKSIYLIIIEDDLKIKEIKNDLELPDNWKIDSVMQEAIDFYESRSVTVIGKLYKSALVSVNAMSEYLEMTADLLRERSANGGTVTTLPMITAANKTLPDIMKNLKTAEKEVLKEQAEMEGRMKGSRTMSMFEEGLDIS